jgi:AcrR family transcriptional regulator
LRPRSEAKRARILDAAMRYFAEKGYEAVRVEDIARELDIAKGSIFQHFESKDGLFVAAYKRAVAGLPKWLDVPPDVREKGFFPVVRYWFDWTRRLADEDWVRERVVLMGAYRTDWPIKREINRFLARQDAYGTGEFVRFGIERGEVRSDVEVDMIRWLLDWMTDRFQDDTLVRETSRGVFWAHEGKPAAVEARIDTFMQMLRGALGRS